MVARIIVAALVALPVSKADSDAIAELFDVLDRDQDGLVMVGEISEAQRPYFERTLRVSDANRDGALSRSELGGALTDPAPRRSAGGPRGGRPRRVFDPERLDKNKDGLITIDEVPFPTRDRFRNALSQTGRDAIPVETMAGLLRRNRPRPGDRMNSSDQRRGNGSGGNPQLDKPKSSGSGADLNGNQPSAQMIQPLLQTFRRLDTNRDGKVNQKEAGQFPQFIGRFDRNRDGVVEHSELPTTMSGSRRVPTTDQTESPRRKRDMADGDRTTDPREIAPAMFDHMDQNSDGAISRREAPERIRSRFDRLDRDGDGRLTRGELTRNGPRQKKSQSGDR